MPNSFTRAALLRWRFVRSLCHYVRVVWPVLSALLVIQWLLGMIVGHVEGWSIGDASYFTFVTARHRSNGTDSQLMCLAGRGRIQSVYPRRIPRHGAQQIT